MGVLLLWFLGLLSTAAQFATNESTRSTPRVAQPTLHVVHTSPRVRLPQAPPMKTVQCYSVPDVGDRPRGYPRTYSVFRSQEAAQKHAAKLGSSVQTVDVFAECAADLPE